MRGVMNDDAKWFALLKETYDTFKYKNILTEEMASLFTKRFGRDMAPIFNQYLRRTEIPALELVFDAPNSKVSYRWKVDEAKFAMPIRVGDKSAWQTITPTVEWQTMDTKLTKDAFDVATDFYFVNVTKTDKTGDLPAVPAAAAARTTPPEQTAYNDANKIKDLGERLTALRKIQAEYPTSNFLRQVNSTVFNLLTRIPEKRAEVAPAFDISVNDAKKMTADQGIQMSLISGNVAQALENGIVIDAAEPTLTALLAAAPADMQTSLKAQTLEVLGRWHQAKGNTAKAESYYKGALKLDPALKNAPVGLAKLAAGNDKAALGYYMQAAAAGGLKGDDDAAFHALYKKVNGSEKNLEADIDRAFRTRFPNPLEPAPWRPTPARTSRIVLSELFTGSACPPCVAADLALDAAMERYPAADMATLVYHVHIPGPDPMTTAASAARKEYYKDYVLGVPTFIVDGAMARLGGGGRDNAGITYGNYASVIDADMNDAPEATLAIKTQTKNGKVAITTAISNLAAQYKEAKGLTLHVVLAEQELRFTGENGMRFHPLVVRAMAGGDKPGIPVTMDASGKLSLDTTFDLSAIPTDITSSLEAEIKKRRGNETAGNTPAVYKAESHPYTDVDPTKLIVVAFLQDADKHVLQAVQKPLDEKQWKKAEKK